MKPFKDDDDDDLMMMLCTAPSTAPRELGVSSVKGRPSWATVSWEEPRQANGKITGETRPHSTCIGLLLVCCTTNLRQIKNLYKFL